MSRDIQKQFADRIIAIRELKEFSQEELAFLCGIDRTYLGRIERLERKPTIVILDKIAKGLGITISRLLDFDISEKDLFN